MALPDNPDPVVIACAADDRYVQPLAVMLRSALANLSPVWTAAIYLLDGGIDPENRRRLAESLPPGRASLHWVATDTSRFSGLPLWGRMPVATYYKLLVPDLLPAGVPRAVWLDCDVVVLGDLARLWRVDAADRHVLAVQDQVVPLVSSPNGVAGYRELGIAPDAKYFNAGVMVMDLALWRRDDVAGRVADHLRRWRDEVVFWDQEGMNAVLAGAWGELDPRWNRNPSIRAGRFRRHSGSTGSQEAVDESWIVHFTGNLKPWVYHGRDPFHTCYFRYLDQTAWAGWRPAPTVAGAAIALYEASGLRDLLYPAEARVIQLLRAVTRRYASEPAG